MALSSLVSVNVGGALSASLDLSASAAVTLAKAYSASLSTGTAAGQADKIYFDNNTLSASATLDVDLAGALTDALGNAATFARVKAIVVAAAAGNTNNVIVGGAASNGFVTPFGGATHTVTVRPGGFLVLACGIGDATGYVVTAATGDLLRISNSGAGTSVTYDLVVIGASA